MKTALGFVAIAAVLSGCGDDSGGGGSGGAGTAGVGSSTSASTTPTSTSTSTSSSSTTSNGQGGDGTGGDPTTGAASSSGGAGGDAPVEGDRYLATDGVDVGDCSVDACATLAYVATQMAAGEVVVVRDGEYADGIDEGLLPRGSGDAWTTVRAEHDGMATFTGAFDLYEEGADFHFELVGLRFDGPDTKAITGSNVRFRRVSFVGGPDSGNAASVGVGTNDFYPGASDILFEDCLFYGSGGRYALLAYRTVDVVVRRAVLRKDGGWGEDGPESTEFEPEGVLNFYESEGGLCEQCVAFDSLKLSDDSAEGLGALLSVANGDPNSVDVTFDRCISANNTFKGFAFEGNGTVSGLRVVDSYAVANDFGMVANTVGDSDLSFERVGVVGNASLGIGNYGSGTITLIDSDVRDNDANDLDGVDGEADGAGPGDIDLTGFDDARIRREMCADTDRGFCETEGSFQDYLGAFLGQ